MKIRMLAAVASCAAASPAAAEDLVFMLDNQTSAALAEFYASPADVGSWEEDILGVDVLPAGEAVRITIADGRSTCVYDMRFVYEDGETVEEEAVDLCETGSYTLAE